MVTPNTVLMSHRDQRGEDGELEGVHHLRVVEQVLDVVEPVAEGALGHEAHRPADQQEQVDDDDRPQAVAHQAGPALRAGGADGRPATGAGVGRRAGGRSRTRTSATAHQPPLQDVDEHDHDERDHQQDRRHRRRADGVVVLDARQDAHRGDLGLEREVARQQHERAVLADPSGERERRAGGDGRDQARQHDPAEGRERRRPERAGRLLDLAVELGQHRLHGAHDERAA